MELSSKIVNSRRTARHEEKSYLKVEKKKKVIGLVDLSERLIEEIEKRIGRVSTNSPTNKAMEAMKEIYKSLFTSWMMSEVKPKEFNPLTLDKF